MTEPQYIDERRVSEILGLSIYTLRNRRRVPGDKLTFFKFNRAVRYRLDDVLSYARSCRSEVM